MTENTDKMIVKQNMIALMVAPNLRNEIETITGVTLDPASGLSLVTPSVWTVDKATMTLQQVHIDPVQVVKAMDSYEHKYGKILPRLSATGHVYIPGRE